MALVIAVEHQTQSTTEGRSWVCASTGRATTPQTKTSAHDPENLGRMTPHEMALMASETDPEVFQAATGVHIRPHFDASNSHLTFSLIINPIIQKFQS